MKSIVEAEVFVSALAKAGTQRRVSKRNGKHLRLDFMGNICRVTGSDFSAWLTVELPADGDTFTFVLEEPRQIIRVCAFLRGPLTVELDGEEQNCKITLSSDGKTATFPVSSPAAYPLPPNERPMFRHTTDVRKLAGRIKSVSYAALEISQRPSYANVYFQDQRLWCVDGYRLAVSQDDSFCAKQPFLIRALDLEQLKLFDKGKVRIEVGKKFVTFLGNGITLICRKTGDQPCVDLDKVIPHGPMEQYAVERKQYMDALKYLFECAHGINRPSVVFDHGVLELTGKHGRYTAGLDVEGKCELPYRFNLRYLLDTGSDLPWLYYPGTVVVECAGAMLPWYGPEYDELDDEHWAQYYDPEEYVKLHPEKNPPELADWYRLDYRNNTSDIDFQPRTNLAQIVYEATGGIMPRDLHRYDDKLKLLRHYGVTGKKTQIPLLYCMTLLGEGMFRSESWRIPYEPPEETYEESQAGDTDTERIDSGQSEQLAAPKREIDRERQI